jgi:hypothetical protein
MVGLFLAILKRFNSKNAFAALERKREDRGF